MRTKKQNDASRRNGAKSNGAATPEGLGRIAAANLKSGVFAESTILPWESAADFDQLKADYFDHHRPASAEARLLLDELISCEWTLRRLRLVESNLWLYSIDRIFKPVEEFNPAQALLWGEKVMGRLQQRITATRLAYHRTLKDLQTVEALQPPAVAAPPAPVPAPVPEPPQAKNGDSQEPVTPPSSNNLPEAAPAPQPAPVFSLPLDQVSERGDATLAGLEPRGGLDTGDAASDQADNPLIQPADLLADFV